MGVKDRRLFGPLPDTTRGITASLRLAALSAALTAAWLLSACSTGYSASDQQVIYIPTKNGVETERVSVGNSDRLDIGSKFSITALVSRSVLPRNWVCEEHPEIIEKMFDLTVASCDSWAYSIAGEDGELIAHDIIVETSREDAESHDVLFRLLDPVAPNAPSNTFEPVVLKVHLQKISYKESDIFFIDYFDE